MRENKYRAWNRAEKRWVTHQEHLEATAVSVSVLPPSVISFSHPDWDFEQFMCLKDKNGREICQGDIVTWNLGKKPQKHVVWWSHYLGGFYLQEQANDDDGGYVATNDRDYEIIGNIHENPDLLPAA